MTELFDYDAYLSSVEEFASLPRELDRQLTTSGQLAHRAKQEAKRELGRVDEIIRSARSTGDAAIEAAMQARVGLDDDAVVARPSGHGSRAPLAATVEALEVAVHEFRSAASGLRRTQDLEDANRAREVADARRRAAEEKVAAQAKARREADTRLRRRERVALTLIVMTVAAAVATYVLVPFTPASSVAMAAGIVTASVIAAFGHATTRRFHRRRHPNDTALRAPLRDHLLLAAAGGFAAAAAVLALTGSLILGLVPAGIAAFLSTST